MKPAIFVVVMLCVTASAVCAGDTGWVSWTAGDGANGHCYRVIWTDSVISWDSASAAAQQAGGFLATITSNEEDAFVADLVSQCSYPGGFGPWLGGYQDRQNPRRGGPADNWTWVAGDSAMWGYTNWNSGTPDDCYGWHSEPYLGYSVGNRRWNDLRGAGDGIRSYVVETVAQAAPEPSSILVLLSGIGALGWLKRGMQR